MWKVVADNVGHPFDGPPVLPDGIDRAALRMVTEGPAKTAQRLASTVAEWTVLAQSLRDGERLTHKVASPSAPSFEREKVGAFLFGRYWNE